MVNESKPYVEVYDITFDGENINVDYELVKTTPFIKKSYDTLVIDYKDLYRYYIELYGFNGFFPTEQLTRYILMRYNYPLYDEITIPISRHTCHRIIKVLREQLKLYGLDKPDAV